MRVIDVASTLSARAAIESGIDHRYRVSDVKLELSDMSFVTVSHWFDTRTCHALSVGTIILTCRSSKNAWS